MKFVKIKTGNIIETNNKLVIDQLKKSDEYKEFKGKTPTNKTDDGGKGTDGEKPAQ